MFESHVSKLSEASTCFGQLMRKERDSRMRLSLPCSSPLEATVLLLFSLHLLVQAQNDPNSTREEENDLPGVRQLKSVVCLDHPYNMADHQVLFRDLSKWIVIIHHGHIVKVQGWLDRRARLRLLDTSQQLIDLLPRSILDRFRLVSAFAFRTRMVLNLLGRQGEKESVQAVIDLSNQLNLVNQTICDQYRNQMHRVEQLICEPVLRNVLRSTDNIYTYQFSRYEYEMLFRLGNEAKRVRILFRVQGYNVSLWDEEQMNSFYSPLGVTSIGWVQPFTDSNALDLGYQTHHLKMESKYTRLLPIDSTTTTATTGESDATVLSNRVLVLPNQVMYGCPPPLCFTPIVDAAFHIAGQEKEGESVVGTKMNRRLKLLPDHIYLFTGLYYYEMNARTLRVPKVNQAKLISTLFGIEAPLYQRIERFSYVDAAMLNQTDPFVLFIKDDKVLRLYVENDEQEFKELSLDRVFRGLSSPYVDYVFEQGQVTNLVVETNVIQFRMQQDGRQFTQVYEPFIIYDPLPLHVHVHLMFNHTR